MEFSTDRRLCSRAILFESAGIQWSDLGSSGPFRRRVILRFRKSVGPSRPETPTTGSLARFDILIANVLCVDCTC